MQGRAERTRDAVLAGAAAAFEELGYAGAGVTAILKRAGTTRGALYFHFTGKQDLAASVVEACDARLTSSFAHIGDASDRSRLPRALAGPTGTDPMVRAGLRLLVEGGPEPSAPRYRKLITALAEQLAEPEPGRGDEAPCDDTLAFILIGAMTGTHAMALTLGRPEGAAAEGAAAMVERACALLIRGASTREPRTGTTAPPGSRGQPGSEPHPPDAASRRH